MDDIYLKDTIEIINETHTDDAVSSRTVIPSVKALVSGKRETRIGISGEPLTSSYHIILKPDQGVNASSKVKIKTIQGTAFQYSQKEFMIISYGKGHNSIRGHVEIWV